MPALFTEKNCDEIFHMSDDLHSLFFSPGYHARSKEDLINTEFKRPLWKISPSEHETTLQLSRMESYLATMSWAVGTCASNQQFASVLKLLKMQTEGEEFQVNEHDYCHKCKKLFLGEEEECLAASCNG